jgi:group II intron reverse transcriptase/maturase
MQNATTVLGVIQKRGKAGQPLVRLYRQLFNVELYKAAYSQIYANDGATTPGSDGATLDGMSVRRWERIISQLREERYRWQAVRRSYIPKKRGGKRPLGIPGGDDKMLQAVMKLLLEAYYEPRFSDRSHGFRPGRGCHTALVQLSQRHRDVSWFIEGDIKGFFDHIDHERLVGILSKDIQDGRFLNLVRRLLSAGYMEEWTWHRSYSGTPQGGIISPLLANIYLNEFDRWVETELLPQYNRKRPGMTRRNDNPVYRRYAQRRRAAKKAGDRAAYKRYGKLMKTVPSVIDDDSYRKLEYVRYADDFLLSFAGPKCEAEEIRERIRAFLQRELGLELCMEKTLITHARTEKARFLGYELRIMRSQERRTVNGWMWFGVPREVITEAKKKYMRNGKAVHRNEWILHSDYDIVANFQAEYRGLAQYYTMAHNIADLSEVEWVTVTSLLKTLAAKHKSSVNQMARKHRSSLVVDGKSYRVFKAIVEREGKQPLKSHFGAIPLKRNPRPADIKDALPRIFMCRSQLLDRMMAEVCEMCGSQGRIQVHHVRKLKDLTRPGRRAKPAWVQRMAAIRRKTLMVCEECHRAIHAGAHRSEWDIWNNVLESRMR